MTSEHNPYEAGLGFAVRKTGGFIGHDALSQINPENITRKLSCLVIEKDLDVVMGKEPVLVNNKVVGYTTSAYYGHSVGAPLAYAWLPIEHSKIGTKVEIQYFDILVKAKVGNDPQFDPDMTRLKS
jgi:glycine cleavage system aminomethyltransferase T